MVRKTTRDLITEYLTTTGSNKAASTQGYKRRLYDRLLKFLDGRQLTFETALAFQESIIANGLGKSSLYSYIKYLKAFVRWAADNEYIEKNWGKKMLLPKLDLTPDFPMISSEIAEKIILAGTEPEPFVFGKSGDNPRNRKIKLDMRDGLQFALRQGLRISEVRAIRAEDLNLDGEPPTFWKRPSKGQGKKLLSPTKDTVEMLRKRGETETGPLFKITDSGCNAALRRGVERLGLGKALGRKITCHSLRHIQATSQLRNGVPLPIIQRQLGHKNFNTTVQMYMDLNVNDLADAVNSQPIVENGLTPMEIMEAVEKVAKKKIGNDNRFQVFVEKSLKNGLILKMIPVSLDVN